jgi:cytochrome c oxidase subunit III
MASFPTTAAVDDPRIALGNHGRLDSPLHEYTTRLRRARLGLFVAVTPILMLLLSFTSAYIVRQGLPTFDPRTNSLTRDWIPVHLPSILLVNTCVLLLSSLGMELARRQIKKETAFVFAVPGPAVSAADGKGLPWLPMTLVLGLLFLFGQWTAWRQLAANGFYVATTPSSSFIYLLTGTHAIHLIGGVIALFVAGMASLLHRPVATRSIVVDVSAWYWHFMAVLWVYILCLLEFAG